MTLISRRPLRLCIVSVAALALIGFAACGDDDAPDTGGDRVQVLTSLPLFADFVRNVGGDRVEVSSLIPSGADPHTWEPDPKDVVKVSDADIVFVNGLDLEPSALNIIEPNVRDGVEIVHMGLIVRSRNLDEAARPNATSAPLNDDPHLWMGVENAKRYAETIADRLSLADPTGELAFGANLLVYRNELDSADDHLMQRAESVPEDNRKLITTHDAFGYLAAHIGFEITAFVSEGPGQDTSPGDIRAIVDAVEEQGVPAVFREPQISGESDILDQVAEDTGAMVCELYSDSLDDEVTTYIELIRFDADELARCLGGPDGG